MWEAKCSPWNSDVVVQRECAWLWTRAEDMWWYCLVVMNLPFPHIMTPSLSELHEGQVSQDNLGAPGIFWLSICKAGKIQWHPGSLHLNVRNGQWKAGGNHESLNKAMARGSYLFSAWVKRSGNWGNPIGTHHHCRWKWKTPRSHYLCTTGNHKDWFL